MAFMQEEVDYYSLFCRVYLTIIANGIVFIEQSLKFPRLFRNVFRIIATFHSYGTCLRNNHKWHYFRLYW